MNIVLAAILILAVPPAAADMSATPTTRLFVRTVPAGAVVTLDAKAIGTTDGLFVISPGTHELSLELEGYRAQTRKIQAPEGRITRLEVKLKGADQAGSGRGRADTPPPTSGSGDAPSAGGTHRLPQGADGVGITSGFVSQGDFADSTRQAMLTVLRQLEPIASGGAPDRYAALARGLTAGSAALAAFFDGDQSVMVMADDPAVRRNRLNLLAVLRNQASVLADFSRING